MYKCDFLQKLISSCSGKCVMTSFMIAAMNHNTDGRLESIQNRLDEVKSVKGED